MQSGDSVNNCLPRHRPEMCRVNENQTESVRDVAWRGVAAIKLRYRSSPRRSVRPSVCLSVSLVLPAVVSVSVLVLTIYAV